MLRPGRFGEIFWPVARAAEPAWSGSGRGTGRGLYRIWKIILILTRLTIDPRFRGFVMTGRRASHLSPRVLTEMARPAGFASVIAVARDDRGACNGNPRLTAGWR